MTSLSAGQVVGGLIALGGFANLPIWEPSETMDAFTWASATGLENDSTDKKVARVLATVLRCAAQFASALSGIAAGVHIFTMTPQAGFFASLLSSIEVIKPYAVVFLASLTAGALSKLYGHPSAPQPNRGEAVLP